MNILNRLTSRERNILYLLSSVALLSLVYNFLIEPIFKNYSNINREIILIKAKLQKSLSIIQEKEKIDKEYTLYAERLKPKASDEQEITHILNNLEVLARNANLKIINMNPKPAQEKDFYKRFLVDIETESDMGSLMRFIYDVKNSPLALKIDRLNLNTRTAQTDVIIRASMVISKITLK